MDDEPAIVYPLINLLTRVTEKVFRSKQDAFRAAQDGVHTVEAVPFIEGVDHA